MLDLNKSLGHLSRVRLRGGVVGKISLTVIVVALALSAIGVAAKEPLVSGGAILAIIIIALPLLWRVIGFAMENPQAAILEGAEFLRHTEITMVSKSGGELQATNATNPTEAHAPKPLPVSIDQPDEPDSKTSAGEHR